MKIGQFQVGLTHPLLLISGPCVIESESFALTTAEELKRITSELSMPFIYKSSFDKANRSSHTSFRGLGFAAGLEILRKVKDKVGVMVLTDVHEDTPLDEIAEVADVLQTPAFLCRQTDFIQRVAACGKPVNVKKGQFLSPWEMRRVVEKVHAMGNQQVMVCERGACFGYNNLVSDMRSLVVMRETACPVIFDATHSVQLPGGADGKAASSGGQREFVAPLARAAVAVGVAGVFAESHPQPDQAPSDGANMWPLGRMKELLVQLQEIDVAVKADRAFEVQ